MGGKAGAAAASSAGSTFRVGPSQIARYFFHDCDRSLGTLCNSLGILRLRISGARTTDPSAAPPRGGKR
jgi:hypothetical protein